MPSSSKKQHNFMEAVAHSPSFAKKTGVPQSVGRDFSKADKNRKFSEGGDTMATSNMNQKMDPRIMKMMLEMKRKQDMNSQVMPSSSRTGLGGGLSGGLSSTGMKKGGMTKMAGGGLAAGHKSANGIAQRGKTKGKEVAMKRGGKC
jgi:hypothetical protein